ncbi:MAG: phosphate acyltransferase PlsX [Coriobacteriales bacterium]|nr:phosphate acyltransferase PlsX [Actinomycetes bacterium]
MVHDRVTVAVDVMGGDRAPGVVLDGVDAALAADDGLWVVITGPDDVVSPFAATRERVRAHATTQVIDMGEHPATAVRSKKDSSIVVGCRLVKDGEADAFFSAGSTGACMAAATLMMGRIKGIARPAIATVIPSPQKPCILLDIGANADCKPEYLVQFAHMGAAFSESVLGVAQPTVGLLNIGTEPTKGSRLAVEAHALMARQLSQFAGNVEGRDVANGTVDVIVTDGFTGNVTLKVLEGLATVLFREIKRTITSSRVRTIAGAMLKGSLEQLRGAMDAETYGGAPLLGVDGVCIIGHGSTSHRGVAAGIDVAARAVRSDLNDKIALAIKAHHD